MSRDIFADAVEWNPDLSPERQKRVEEHRQRFAAPASLFKEVRKHLGLSQVQAAIRLGTSQANVSKIEKRSGTDLGQIEKLAADSDFEIVVLLRSKDRRQEFVLTG